MGQLEEYFAAAEEAATRVSLALKDALKVATRIKAAARVGDVSELRRAAEALQAPLDRAQSEQTHAAPLWSRDIEPLLQPELLYAELEAAGQAAGVGFFARDGRLLAPPVALKALPKDRAVELDRRRQRNLRPSVLVQAVRARLQRPRFRPKPVFERIVRAAKLLIAANPPDLAERDIVRWIDIHDILTLGPRGSDYRLEEFKQDVYMLATSPPQRTADGIAIEFVGPRSRSNKGTLVAIDEHGQERDFFAVRLLWEAPGG